MRIYASQLQTLAQEFRDDPKRFARSYFLVRAGGRDTSPVLRIYDPCVQTPWNLGIGRANDNKLFIDQRSISWYHATLSFAGRVDIQDEHSSNGTFVNGQRIPSGRSIPIEAGTTLTFGTEEWAFHDYATLSSVLQ